MPCLAFFAGSGWIFKSTQGLDEKISVWNVLTVSCPVKKDSNGPTDAYAAIAQVDVQRQEPESLRKWREEQMKRLEELGEPRTGDLEIELECRCI